MTIISAIPGGSGDAYARLVERLRSELGCSDIAAIADRIFEAEKAEFHWEARVRERYLGQHFPLDCGIDLLWRRSFERHEEATDAFVRAR